MNFNEPKTHTLLNYFEDMNFKASQEPEGRVIKVYSDVDEELNTLNTGVGLRNVSHMGIMELKGADVLDFLHRVTTNGLKDLKKEQVTQTIFTTEKGRIIDVVEILNFETHQLMICSPIHKPKLKSWIDKYTISDDVKVIDTENKYSIIDVLGPQANSFLMFVCGGMINNIPENSFKIVNTEGLLFFVVRLNFGKEQFRIIADNENAKGLVKFISENKGPYEVNFIGEDAYEIYRVKAGVPKAPNELNDDYNPHEAKLKTLISFTKGCYIGQEVIARLDTYDKVQYSLTGVKLNSENHELSSRTLFDEDGKEAGEITSVVFAPKLNRNIGLAYVRKAYDKEGTQLFSLNSNGKVPVTIVNLPFKR